MDPVALSVDPDPLRAAARGVLDAAEALCPLPGVDLGVDLAGSALEQAVLPDLRPLAAGVLRWAHDAASVADGLVDADASAAARLWP